MVLVETPYPNSSFVIPQQWPHGAPCHVPHTKTHVSWRALARWWTWTFFYFQDYLVEVNQTSSPNFPFPVKSLPSLGLSILIRSGEGIKKGQTRGHRTRKAGIRWAKLALWRSLSTSDVYYIELSKGWV